MGTADKRERCTLKSVGRVNVHGKALVQIQVADITAARRRICETDLCVEIRTIEVNLASVLVDDSACL